LITEVLVLNACFFTVLVFAAAKVVDVAARIMVSIIINATLLLINFFISNLQDYLS